MTEREYLENLGADFNSNDLNKDMSNRWKLKALSMAKAQGAKFDSEPIELPRLTTRPHVYGAVVELAEPRTRNRIIYLLTQAEADEVVRRCELLPKLRNYLKSLTPGVINPEIVDLIDGKVEW